MKAAHKTVFSFKLDAAKSILAKKPNIDVFGKRKKTEEMKILN